jgi:hypothetical protein
LLVGQVRTNSSYFVIPAGSAIGCVGDTDLMILTVGTLGVNGNIKVDNNAYIGCDSDTDLIQISSGIATVNGDVEITGKGNIQTKSGTTEATGNTEIDYPSGFTKDNCSIVSFMVQIGNSWQLLSNDKVKLV